METHFNDILTLPSTGLQDVKSAQILVSCELMKNQVKASPIEPNDNILVAQDSKGQPLIFTIGADGILRLLQFSAGSVDGFSSINLMDGFKDYDKAITFDISEDLKGRISIAFSLSLKTTGFTDVFIAENIPNNADWSTFAALCKKAQGIDASFIADHIRLGTTDINNNAMVLATGKINDNEYYYEINGTDFTAVKMELPENVHQATEIEIGFAFGQKAKFFLYGIGDSQTLECTTIADKFEGSLVYDFSPGNAEIPLQYQKMAYNCMQTAYGTQTNPMLISSDLYIGTAQGIFLFNGCKIKDGGFQVVTDKIKDVHQLYITQDTSSISVWAMVSPNNLYYIYGKKSSAGYTWNDPILFNTETIHIAPIRNKIKLSNELYLVDQNENLIHCWQDPTSTIWNQRTINVKASDYLINLDSFTTKVKITDQDGKILPNENISITSSEWLFVNINGKIYSLDMDNPAIVATDGRGMINIIQLTDNIASPIFHLDAAFLDKIVNIYPNGKIQHGLSQISSGADLQNAKDADGNPVLTQTQSSDTLDGVSSNLSQLTGAAATHKTGVVKDGDLFTSLTDKGTRETGKLNLSHLPDNFIIGMKLENGTWKPHTDAGGFIRAGGIGDDFLTAVGDAFKWLETAFEDGIKLVEKGVTYLKDGVSFVVKKIGDALHFVLSIADKILTIVLDTLLTVFKAINWVLKLIGIDLQAILRWLGHLLGLDDIWKTHKVIAALMNNGVNYGAGLLESKLQDLESFLSTTLNNAEDMILKQVLPANIASQSLSQSGSIDSPLNSSAGDWIFSQIFNNNLFGGGSSGSVSHNPFEQFVNDVIQPTVSVLINDLEQFFKDFTGLLSGNIADAYKLIADLIKLVIDPIKTIILGILKFLEDLAGDLAAALTEIVDIPFLNTMYKFFTSLLGEEEDLTIVNAVAFIIAIPYTFISKTMLGHAPFAQDDYGMQSPDYYKNLFSDQTSPFLLAGSSSGAIAYSKIGGSIASVAGVVASILTLIGFMEDDDGENQGLSTLDKIAMGFSVLTASLSFPIKKDDQNHDSYVLKTCTWVLAIIKDLGFKFIPKKEIAAGAEAIADGVIFCMAMPADSLNGENAGAYFQDVLSNCGGAAAAGGMAFKKTEAGLIIGAVGAGIAYIGAIIGLVNCLQSDGIVHNVNPGG